MINATIKEKNFAPVVKALETLDERVLQAIAKALARGLEQAVTTSQTEYFHEGTAVLPDKLRAVTGTLRKGVVSEVKIVNGGVIGRIGDAVKYAAYHEFGFRGTQHVRAHTRIVEASTAENDRLYRRPIMRDGVVIGYKESLRKLVSRMKGAAAIAESQVKTHSRTVNYAGRPFVRPALEKTLPLIQQEINAELAKLQ